jgi:predicted nuclease of predicted toxin-antitoxin system
VKLYLDEDLSPAVAETLRRRGVDALAAGEAGNHGRDDAAQLATAARARRCLVTRNRDDFVRLSREAIRDGAAHAGIILCPPSVRGDEIGMIAAVLFRIARRYPGGLGSYDVIFL